MKESPHDPSWCGDSFYKTRSNDMEKHFLQLNMESIAVIPEFPSSPVAHALKMLSRDWNQVLGSPLHTELHGKGNRSPNIILRYVEESDGCPDRPETFVYRFISGTDGPVMHIAGTDDLGLVYGILHFSKEYLGVDPFWFWADLPPACKSSILIPATDYLSPEPAVRYRGWFVNDEVCLIGWKEEYPPTFDVWQPVFEALLRCGGNMVIPGTDLPKNGIHWDLASEMGLWITHHHAEPLGAELFLRAYPGHTASYKDHPDLFEHLWQEAIDKQKDKKLVWVLSFRGQGDKPFWENDPSFQTPAQRGGLISQVIRKQYDMIHEAVAQPVCSVALYGEIAELYKAGHIELPEDVIKIWADNGYGKMVSRRHGNINLRTPALPDQDDGGKHGIYYHVTFHDLQASNHLTMFPSSAAFIAEEVEAAFHAGAKEYVLVNSGNIRQHVYTLDLLSQLWNCGQVTVSEHLDPFVRKHFSGSHDGISSLYQRYSEHTIPYGPHRDDRAGEEFYHHPARRIIGHWLRGQHHEPDSGLYWATGEIPFSEQVQWFGRKCEDAIGGWKAWLQDGCHLLEQLNPEDQRRLKDHLLFHGELHLSGCMGFSALAKSYAAFREAYYPQAFVYANQSMRHYADGLTAMRLAENGKWTNFYRADWLTNIESTVNNLDTLRRFIRMFGDSPDFFLWYKEYLMPETEKHIYLENTHRNPLSDTDLANTLEKRFQME